MNATDDHVSRHVKMITKGKFWTLQLNVLEMFETPNGQDLEHQGNDIKSMVLIKLLITLCLSACLFICGNMLNLRKSPQNLF